MNAARVALRWPTCRGKPPNEPENSTLSADACAAQRILRDRRIFLRIMCERIPVEGLDMDERIAVPRPTLPPDPPPPGAP